MSDFDNTSFSVVTCVVGSGGRGLLLFGGLSPFVLENPIGGLDLEVKFWFAA